MHAQSPLEKVSDLFCNHASAVNIASLCRL